MGSGEEMAPRLESLWNFYQEHAAQARQHEDQREHMTNIILIIAGALITFVSSRESANVYSLLSSLALIPLGVFGWAFSYKHYERNHIHRAILAKVREAIDDELATPSAPGQNSPTLKQLRDAGELLPLRRFSCAKKTVPEECKELDRPLSAQSLLVHRSFIGHDSRNCVCLIPRS